MDGDYNLQHVSINFTLKDHIYDVLREGNIYEGDEDLRLDERQLAQQLGVSRTPIREALARLAQDGLVEILPRKGVFIHRKSEILDMVVTWAALESMAAHIAASVASTSEIRALREFAERHSVTASSAELSEYSDANIKFHQAIFDMSGSPLSKIYHVGCLRI